MGEVVTRTKVVALPKRPGKGDVGKPEGGSAPAGAPNPYQNGRTGKTNGNASRKGEISRSGAHGGGKGRNRGKKKGNGRGSLRGVSPNGTNVKTVAGVFKVARKDEGKLSKK